MIVSLQMDTLNQTKVRTSCDADKEGYETC